MTFAYDSLISEKSIIQIFLHKNNWNKMIFHLSNSLFYLHYCWPDLTKDSAGHMGKLNMWRKFVFFDILWKQQSLSPTKLCFLFILKQNLPSPNMPLWHKDYFKLVIFKKLQTQEKLWKPRETYPSIRNVYIYKGELSL